MKAVEDYKAGKGNQVDETVTLKMCTNWYKAFFTGNDDAYCCEECEIMEKK